MLRLMVMRDLSEVERLLGELEGCLLLDLALVRAGLVEVSQVGVERSLVGLSGVSRCLVESNVVRREFRRVLRGCGVDG